MNQTPSLINLVNEFKSLSIRHKMIKDFGCGSIYDIDLNGDMQCPFMWIEIGDTDMIYSEANHDYVSDEITFNVYVMDKIRKGDKNELDVHNDTHDILRQCVKELMQAKYYRDNMIKIMNNITLQQRTHEEDSDFNGYFAEIILNVPNRMNPCNSPFSEPFDTTI